MKQQARRSPDAGQVTTAELEAKRKADIEILKTLRVCDENMAEIEMKLVNTMEYRIKMLETLEVDLLETLPYFFTNPELVCFSHFLTESINADLINNDMFSDSL